MNDPLSHPLEASDRRNENKATRYICMFFFCLFEKLDNVWKNYLHSDIREAIRTTRLTSEPQQGSSERPQTTQQSHITPKCVAEIF